MNNSWQQLDAVNLAIMIDGPSYYHNRMSLYLPSCYEQLHVSARDLFALERCDWREFRNTKEMP